MASKCTNCNATLGCSCKVRTANDGTKCCKACVASYNKAHPTPATKASVLYKGPGKQISGNQPLDSM